MATIHRNLLEQMSMDDRDHWDNIRAVGADDKSFKQKLMQNLKRNNIFLYWLVIQNFYLNLWRDNKKLN